MKNNEIMINNDNIFSKIRRTIHNLFHKDKKQNKKTEENNIYDDINKEYKSEYISEKERIFTLYEDMKKGNIDIYEIPSQDLNMIKELLLSEIDLKEKKLDEIQTDINRSKYNIECYKKEKSKYLNNN